MHHLTLYVSDPALTWIPRLHLGRMDDTAKKPTKSTKNLVVCVSVKKNCGDCRFIFLTHYTFNNLSAIRFIWVRDKGIEKAFIC